MSKFWIERQDDVTAVGIFVDHVDRVLCIVIGKYVLAWGFQ